MKVVGEIIAMYCKKKPVRVSGKAILYFEKETRSLQLGYGDELIIKNAFKAIPAARNPEEFDYRRFLSYKNIDQQAYVTSDEWVHTKANTGNSLIRYAMKIRKHVLAVFQAANLKDDEFSVASALLVGNKDKLDTALYTTYSEAGVMHILSISGMHVALVFFIFNKLLFFLDKLKYGRSLKTILLLFFLWFYALLSGLSPSVLRAATMLSFIVCAKNMKRNSNTNNSLAASAFFLLVLNPYLIVDVGFQLSYLAVIGIVSMQPGLFRFMSTGLWLPDKMINLISVSIAAQLTTFPVSLYYFHQFPNYFLLSNLLVIPLSTVVMYLGIMLIAVYAFPLVFKYASLVFSMMIELLNELVSCISHLPYAITKNCSIQTIEMVLLYGLILFLYLFLCKKHVYFLKFFLYLSILILCLRVAKQKKEHEQKKIIAYSIPHVTAIDFISGRVHVLLVDSSNTKKESRWLDHMRSSWLSLGLNAPLMATEKIKTEFICIEDELIQFYDKRIVLLKKKGKLNSLQNNGKKFPADYVIISNDAAVSILQIQKIYQPGCILFTESNSADKLRKWENECKQLKQPYYSLKEGGAFVLNI